ncbi:LysR family transcriptional regulator [Luteibacter rhizovicinus]|uniref:LysR family transcriptional regulator n=1 Tax=Luteibacter rhizovicinus TaxID=242606 RepID=A0A4R3YQ51_9GAMM|nr:LysR family transcriptional regulator [Luteibacter rhizovicinus]TCV93324.1 LysR family transcriptional regulator [Luteibacter rhizovicinus]
MALRNLDDLTVFLKVLDCQSFSAAARALDLAPATVSKQVARLEAALGTSLFERNTRRLKVTDEGRAVAQRVRAAVALLDEAGDVARQGNDGLFGMLRVTAPVLFGSRYVAAAIAAFRERHPQVGFELHLTDRVVDLYASDLDLAIRFGRLADSRLLARGLATSRRILVASPDYIRRHGQPIHPRDLRQHRCLLFAYPGLRDNRWSLRKIGGRNLVEQVDVNSDLSSDNGDALRVWSAAGMGIALRETWNAAGDLCQGTLLRVLPEWEEPGTPISAVRARRDPVPARLAVFIDFLAELWTEPAPWDRLLGPSADSKSPGETP